jgi:hypothetical protein
MVITPREIFILFTAGWLGGGGALAAMSATSAWPDRLIGAAQVVAAVLWFIPKLRPSGFGAMLAVLIIEAIRQVMIGAAPGSLVFYAAVVAYFTIEDGRTKPSA